MDWAELSEMLYPSSTYFTALTSQASQRWLNAAFKLYMYWKGDISWHDWFYNARKVWKEEKKRKTKEKREKKAWKKMKSINNKKGSEKKDMKYKILERRKCLCHLNYHIDLLQDTNSVYLELVHRGIKKKCRKRQQNYKKHTVPVLILSY